MPVVDIGIVRQDVNLRGRLATDSRHGTEGQVGCVQRTRAHTGARGPAGAGPCRTTNNSPWEAGRSCDPLQRPVKEEQHAG